MDGSIHNEKEQNEYDERRTKELAGMGTHVLRFTNDEVEKDMLSVLKRITRYLNENQPNF